MARATVAILNTSAGTVRDDYRRLLDLIGLGSHLSPEVDTVLGLDLPWHHYAPACSTPPWQIDGVTGALINAGFDAGRIIASINGDIGVSVRHGEVLNRQRPAVERHGIELTHPGTDMKFTILEPKARMRVLDKLYPKGIPVPERFIGSNAVMLTIMRTQQALTVAGALYTGFSATLDKRRYCARGRFHDALVDVLALQREMHPGMIAVADGAFAGQGPDPRRLKPYEKNVILASADPVALDTVMAHMMGFDPANIAYLRIAGEAGLGVSDYNDIDLVGDDVSGVNYHFNIEYPGSSYPPKGSIHCRGPLARLAPGLSMIYHDWYWYTHHSEKIVSAAMKTEWGSLFEEYRK